MNKENFKVDCPADEKGICTIGIANKCVYGNLGDCCKITDFTDFLLIKLLKERLKDD